MENLIQQNHLHSLHSQNCSCCQTTTNPYDDLWSIDTVIFVIGVVFSITAKMYCFERSASPTQFGGIVSLVYPVDKIRFIRFW